MPESWVCAQPSPHLHRQVCVFKLQNVAQCRAGSRTLSLCTAMGVAVVIQVIMLNGGSSSGKTTIATCLQASLPSSWLRLGVDTLLDAMPQRLLTSESGIAFGDDGSVRPGREFRRLEAAWMQGVAAMA